MAHIDDIHMHTRTHSLTRRDTHNRGRRRVVEVGDAMMRDTLMRSFGTNRAGPRDRE